MLVIITARKNSKRCPDKNIMHFADNQNIVRRTVEKARWLNPAQIIVTTDYLWFELGIHEEHYYKRPRHLCGDDITSEAVVEDVVKYTGEKDSFVLMQPTSPIRSEDTLCRAKARFERGDIPALISVNPAYQPNGAFYFVRTKDFLREKSLYPEGTHLWVCSWEESIDINYPWEFRIAEAVHKGDVHGGCDE